MCTLVSSLLQLERRKANNMSRLPSEESYQASTVILQGANMGEGYSLIPNLPDRQVQKSDRINSDRINDTLVSSTLPVNIFNLEGGEIMLARDNENFRTPGENWTWNEANSLRKMVKILPSSRSSISVKQSASCNATTTTSFLHDPRGTGTSKTKWRLKATEKSSVLLI